MALGRPRIQCVSRASELSTVLTHKFKEQTHCSHRINIPETKTLFISCTEWSPGLSSTLSLALIRPIPPVDPRDTQRRLLMLGFIYLTDLRLEGKERGSSCRGTEGTFEEVPQCSVPHYCFFNEEERRTAADFPSGCTLHGSCCLPHF